MQHQPPFLEQHALSRLLPTPPTFAFFCPFDTLLPSQITPYPATSIPRLGCTHNRISIYHHALRARVTTSSPAHQHLILPPPAPPRQHQALSLIRRPSGTHIHSRTQKSAVATKKDAPNRTRKRAIHAAQYIYSRASY